jgi:cytochrome c2
VEGDVTRFLYLPLAACAVVVSAAVPARAQNAQVERGKYLVEEVARCQECHTPKTESGDFDRTKWMKGTTLIGVPSSPVPDWHQKSPDISSTSALWTRWGQDGLSKFLQTAKNPRGGKAGPPMPAYMMKADDADAIVAYLKTLP